MKVLHVEGVATHNGPEPCVTAGNLRREALAGGGVGRVLSRERHEPLRGADAMEVSGRPRRALRYRERRTDPARSKTLCMHPNTSCGNREVPRLASGDGVLVRIGNPKRERR